MTPSAARLIAEYEVTALESCNRRGMAAVLRHLARAHGDPESFYAVRPETLEQIAKELG